MRCFGGFLSLFIEKTYTITLDTPPKGVIYYERSKEHHIYRGVEQLVARRAHNPEVVWFKSHPRNQQCEPI